MKIKQTTFEELKEIWKELLQKNEVNEVFLTYEWLTTWWNVYGKDKQLLLLKITDNNEVIGIAPLMIENKVIKFIGDPHSDYHDFIICKNKEWTIREIIGHIRKNIKHKLMNLTNIPDCSSTISILERNSKIYFKKILNVCPYIRINSSYEDFKKSMKSKLRKNIKRGLELYEDKLGFNIENGDLNKFFDLHKKRWDNTKTPSRFNKEIHKSFFEGISKLNFFKLSYLKFEDKTLAFHAGLYYNNKAFSYMPAYDPDYYKMSPGFVLLNLLIKNSFENNLNEFDFGNGAEEYKNRFSEDNRTNYMINVYNDNLVSYLYYLKDKNYENLKKILRKNDFLISVLRKMRENYRYYFKNEK